MGSSRHGRKPPLSGITRSFRLRAECTDHPERHAESFYADARTLTDAAYATFAAKNNYKRTRPFVVNKEPSCTPNEEAALAKDGSYPSGHSSIGWAWALILAEIAPDRADAILSRGYAFGQSRVICGVHWQSDVHAGRVIAAAVVAKLHADRVFLAQLAAAKKELTAARAKRFKPENDCQAEAAALTLR